MPDIINNIPLTEQEKNANGNNHNDEKFIPKGAIAFFVVLILICASIWYSIYYIALSRQ